MGLPETQTVTGDEVLAHYRDKYAGAVAEAASRSRGAGAAAFNFLLKQARRDLELLELRAHPRATT